MAIHVALNHKTHYTYDRSVGHGPHVIRLRPAPHCRTRILSYSQRVTGGEHFINWQQDPFSNWNARVVFPEPMNELCIEVDVVAEMAVYNPFDFFLEDYATHFPFSYEAGQRKNLGPFLEPMFPGAKLSALIMRIKREILRHP
jgi:transglutaminase-like putative cysteine protease